MPAEARELQGLHCALSWDDQRRYQNARLFYLQEVQEVFPSRIIPTRILRTSFCVRELYILSRIEKIYLFAAFGNDHGCPL